MTSQGIQQELEYMEALSSIYDKKNPKEWPYFCVLSTTRDSIIKERSKDCAMDPTRTKEDKRLILDALARHGISNTLYLIINQNSANQYVPPENDERLQLEK